DEGDVCVLFRTAAVLGEFFVGSRVKCAGLGEDEDVRRARVNQRVAPLPAQRFAGEHVLDVEGILIGAQTGGGRFGLRLVGEPDEADVVKGAFRDAGNGRINQAGKAEGRDGGETIRVYGRVAVLAREHDESRVVEPGLGQAGENQAERGIRVAE